VPAYSNLLILLFATILAYLIGGMPFGYWLVRLTTGQDIRKVGSGNIGATNVHRTVGRKAGIMVLILDILKGFVAVWLAAQFTHDSVLAVALAAVAVMIGHCYPVFLGFKGGKAVACFIGAFLYLAPLALAAIVPVFFAIVALSKYISLGSILGALIFPALVWLIGPHSPEILNASLGASLLIVYRHVANISRLLTGRENKFSLKGGSAP